MEMVGIIFGLLVLVGVLIFCHTCKHHAGTHFYVQVGGVRLRIVGNGENLLEEVGK